MKTTTKCDVLIVGAGVVGISAGIALLEANPALKVIIAEKENRLAMHASGRNSGVVHAGFYYSPDSLKARFCRDGNVAIRKLAKKYSVPVRETGKIVVAKDEDENLRLDDLFNRGIKNKVEIELQEVSKLKTLEPLAITHERFLWSPTTAVSSPIEILNAMCKEFESLGGKIEYNAKIQLDDFNGEIIDSTGAFTASLFINAAGAQSDRVSRFIGIGEEYAMLPFMGLYRATNASNLPIRRLIYPVPHPINPFLGVHFTLTLDNKIKIGPTAIPVAGREQYSLRNAWSLSDILQSLKGARSLISKDEHDVGALIKMELPNILKSNLVKKSIELVPSAGNINKWIKHPPGIRAQLVHLPTGRLEQDFVIKRFSNSIHVLNMVSPGWTCSIPFGKYLVSTL
ncbi:MAG: hypothetical protein RL129_108 [Actinomycetota bacterium]|jgi:L-2-hydroxyglutarate oxidase LhgO